MSDAITVNYHSAPAPLWVIFPSFVADVFWSKWRDVIPLLPPPPLTSRHGGSNGARNAENIFPSELLRLATRELLCIQPYLIIHTVQSYMWVLKVATLEFFGERVAGLRVVGFLESISIFRVSQNCPTMCSKIACIFFSFSVLLIYLRFPIASIGL